ncbi:hypothetical protein H0H81_008173 [Sphagnurus paluster]|uniref:Mediator of RNA polymerase II transcription subunit 7 n=1 Tax=Sphagnurus paluster TaxID=117069 RepID=A0A9P7FQD3_9AGAR|nr:hypothetical protein H0H81_008173 [Sphagnurus paluster]
MDDDEAELRNPFPSPPSHYTKYTSHNLKLLSLLRERVPDPSESNQFEVLADQTDVPDWPLTQLEKPRVDWILEEPDAYYDVFGDRWFVRCVALCGTRSTTSDAQSTQVKEKIPSLAELGGNQLYPVDPGTDRRPALLSILRSLLVTYSSLMSSLLAPPPSAGSNSPPEWHRHVEWITVLSQNIMAAANDLRPMQVLLLMSMAFVNSQARGNLEHMMRRQLELRKSETQALHSKCDTLEARLAELQKSMQDLSARGSPTSKDASQIPQAKKTIPSAVTQQDVLRWAEDIG